MSANEKTFTILVVDDEEILRDTIAFDFQRKGFNVLTAENGTKAFEVIKGHEVDLVISDMRMPGGDGISLLEKIREMSPDLPHLIFMTGFSNISEKECLEMGAKKVLSKPFDRKLLFETVNQILGISQNAG